MLQFIQINACIAAYVISHPPPPLHPNSPPLCTCSEVKRRALRHPGLSSALGGEIQEFSDVEMSTVGTAGGSFAPGGSRKSGPSRVIKARLRFSGRRRGAGSTGWAEVEVSDWENLKGEDGTEGMDYDRILGEFFFVRKVYFCTCRCSSCQGVVHGQAHVHRNALLGTWFVGDRPTALGSLQVHRGGLRRVLSLKG